MWKSRMVGLLAAAVIPAAAFAAGQHSMHDHGPDKAQHGQPHDQHAAPAKPAPAPAAAKEFRGRVVELAVTEEGFVPANVTVKKGEPLKLVVTRKTDMTCAKDLVLDEEKIHQALPLNKPVEILFTPKKAGELRYGCAMGKMVAGVLTVQ